MTLDLVNDNIAQAALEFRKGLLGSRDSMGMCAVVCWPLAGFLSSLGIDCKCEEIDLISVDGGITNHVWIRLSDGRYLDPTADQFGFNKPVYLGKRPPKFAGWRQGSKP
jgi:hypothetical protein